MLLAVLLTCAALLAGDKKPKEKDSIPRAIVEHIAKRVAEGCGDRNKAELPDPADIVTVEPFNVDVGGAKALLVRTQHECLCGAGNCLIEIWVQAGRREYDRIFEDDAYDIRLLTSSHAGRYDLVVESRLTDTASPIVVYQWDGRTYVAAEIACRLGDGPVKERKITRGQCPDETH